MSRDAEQLVQILEGVLRNLRGQEEAVREEVLMCERRINRELMTLKQYVVNKTQLQQEKEKEVVINKKKEEIDQKLEIMMGEFVESVQAKKLGVGRVGGCQRGGSKEREKGKEVGPAKIVKREEPKKVVEMPKIPVLPKPKIETFQRSSFAKPIQEISFKERKIGKVNIKQWIKQYKDQQLKNLQSERKGRMSFLNALNRYAPQRNKIIPEYTDKHPIRGWKGCEYSSVFLKYLQSINQEGLTELLGPKTKVSELYRWNQIGARLMDNWEILKTVKNNIKGPKLLGIQMHFNPLVQEQQSTNKKTDEQPLDIDVCLNEFYRKAQTSLQKLLQIQQGMKKDDLKLLVEICNVVLSKGKKCFTVIKYSELDYMLDIISNGPKRGNK